MSLRYRRILLKLSGEVLGGKAGFGIDPEGLKIVAAPVRVAVELGAQVGLVIGGGNIFRGSDPNIVSDRVPADYMGMLATIINALAVQGELLRQRLSCIVMSSIVIPQVTLPFGARMARDYLEEGCVVVFAGGTGNPYFTTDTAAALRALEIEADILIKATKVGGIYDKDPVLFGDAEFFAELDYDMVLERNLKVMDSTAVSLCRDSNLEMSVLDIHDENNIKLLLTGNPVGSIVAARRRVV
ncbi:MAG: UMP kinase [Desulfomonilia bacterium]|nr:UMP kinase [Desulfomonilia bacterium]